MWKSTGNMNFLNHFLYTFIGFALFVSVCEALRVSETGCTDNGNQCNGIENSACAGETGQKKCKCSEGFTEAGDKCLKAVSDTPCTEAGKECDSIPNAHCDTDKCTCDAGFTMNVNVCSADSAAVTATMATTVFAFTVVAILKNLL